MNSIMNRRLIAPTLLLLGAMAFERTGSAAPINTDTALPIHEGELLWREQVRFMRASVAGVDKRVTAVPSVFVYGVTEKLALIGMVPYLDKELEMDGIERGSSGLGDTTLFGRYQVFQADRPGETMRGQVLGGIKFPTGKDDERDALGLLPPPLQSGSGSYDATVTGVFTWQRLQWQLDVDLGYRVTGEANDFRFGDSLVHNVSLQYRLWPGALPTEGVPSFVYGVVELNGLWSDRDEMGGTSIPDSGGYTLFLSPGVQYVTSRWIAEASVQLPVVRNLNGTQPEPDYTVAAGFRIQF